MFIVLICSACSSPTIAIKPNIPIQRLGLYLDADPMSFLYKGLNKQMDDFIIRYNAKSGNRFVLYRASGKDSTTIRIKLVATRFVSPGEQSTGVVVSMIGLSLPVVLASSGAPFVVFFYYFPKTKSLTEVSVSPDINNMPVSPKQFIFSSPGFLMSPERQADKHVVYFERFLLALVKSVESQVKAPRRPSYVVN